MASEDVEEDIALVLPQALPEQGRPKGLRLRQDFRTLETPAHQALVLVTCGRKCYGVDPLLDLKSGVRATYVGRLLSGTIFDSTRDLVAGKHVGGVDEPLKFNLGRRKVVPGFDAAIASMCKGEIASFVLSSAVGYGDTGSPPMIGPGNALHFDFVELVRFDRPVPELPSKADIERGRREREAEAKELARNEPTIDERIAMALESKERGNQLVKAGTDMMAAKKAYDEGFVRLFFSKEEWNSMLGTEERAKVDAVKLPLYLNRALCNLFFHDWDATEWDCNKALEIDEENAKATFRRGLAQEGRLCDTLAKEDAGEFWDPDRAAVTARLAAEDFSRALHTASHGKKAIKAAIARLHKHLAALQQHKQRYVKARTRLFRDGIFKGLQAQNEAQEAKERAQQAAAAAAAEAAGEAEASDAPGDDDDMPGLEDV